MKTIVLAVTMLLFCSSLVMAKEGLDGFLDNLNVQARADMNGFSVKLSTQFGVPLPQVQVVISKVAAPADAFMCFQLGQMTRNPYEKVLQVYKTNMEKGWGVIAKNLGIKPGSPEFHALKRGEFVFDGQPRDVPGKGKGKGKGKGSSN